MLGRFVWGRRVMGSEVGVRVVRGVCDVAAWETCGERSGEA